MIMKKYLAECIGTAVLVMVGCGTADDARANAFRVTPTGVYGVAAYATGADYAEMFEWQDGNPEAEDRRGRFVTLRGDKISLAGPSDSFILGIVSGRPSVCGDVYDDQWQGMYLTDVYGTPVWEDVEVPDETIERIDPETEETVVEVVVPAHTERQLALNPAYDHTKPYIPRSQRPEWDAVGLVGKLVAVDDGTCQPGGWAAPGADGIATASAERTRFRVMARLDEGHVKLMVL